MTNLQRKPKKDEITEWIRSAHPDVPDVRAEAFALSRRMARRHLWEYRHIIEPALAGRDTP